MQLAVNYSLMARDLLRGGHIDGASSLLDQADRGEADSRPEKVDEAGHEEADAGFRIDVVLHFRSCSAPHGRQYFTRLGVPKGAPRHL